VSGGGRDLKLELMRMYRGKRKPELEELLSEPRLLSEVLAGLLAS
jgi:hypothetical protein